MPAPEEWLIRVESRTFVAGAIVRDGIVVDCAPILRAVARPMPRRGRDLVRRLRERVFRVTWRRCGILPG